MRGNMSSTFFGIPRKLLKTGGYEKIRTSEPPACEAEAPFVFSDLQCRYRPHKYVSGVCGGEL